MFRKILSPIDLRKLSMAALEIASTLAEQNHATISLVRGSGRRLDRDGNSAWRHS